MITRVVVFRRFQYGSNGRLKYLRVVNCDVNDHKTVYLRVYELQLNKPRTNIRLIGYDTICNE